MVSHDRYMLDETVSAIAELDVGAVRMWPGNYSSYVTARELALLQQQEQWRARQKEIERLNDAIRRYKQWRVVSDDPRHTTRIKNAERRIEKLDTVERPVLERRKIGLQLRSAERGGKRVVDLRGVTAAFDSDPVLMDVDLTIFRGERLAVIGPNGAGQERAPEPDHRRASAGRSASAGSARRSRSGRSPRSTRRRRAATPRST